MKKHKWLIIAGVVLPGIGILAYFLLKKKESSTPTIDAILAGKVPSTPIIGYTPDITKYTTGSWNVELVMQDLGAPWSGTKRFILNGKTVDMTEDAVKRLMNKIPAYLPSY